MKELTKQILKYYKNTPEINIEELNSNKTIKEILIQDIDIIIEDIEQLIKNGYYRYDDTEKEWILDGDYIEDYLWYGTNVTILSPKTLYEPVKHIIEFLVH